MASLTGTLSALHSRSTAYIKYNMSKKQLSFVLAPKMPRAKVDVRTVSIACHTQHKQTMFEGDIVGN